jgi:hypothetical protein
MRRDWDAFFRDGAAPMPLHNVVAGGVPAEWISAKRQASSQGDPLSARGRLPDRLDRLPSRPRAASVEARVLAIDYLQRRETLLDDTVNFAEKARAAGVEVEVAIFDDMISCLPDVRG